MRKMWGAQMRKIRGAQMNDRPRRKGLRIYLDRIVHGREHSEDWTQASPRAVFWKHTKAKIKQVSGQELDLKIHFLFLRQCVANVWNGMRHSGLPALI